MRPSGLAAALLVGSVVTRRRALGAAALGVLAVFSMPVVARTLIRSLEHHVRVVAAAQSPVADAVFPLGGVLMAQQRLDSPTVFGHGGLRFERALDLYFTGHARFIVLSAAGIRTGFPSEGERLRMVAIARGVPAEAVIVTREAPDTAAEAEAFHELAVQRHWTRLLLVTSAFHMWRAQFLFRNCGAQVIPVAVDFSDAPQIFPLTMEWWMPQAIWLAESESAIKEYEGMVFYSVVRR